MAATHEFKTLTPSQAEALLSKNDANRVIREMKVKQYARDMESGEWDLCAAPIVVDKNGRLIDGQHRLTAQVRAKKKIKWLFLNGVEPELQNNIDTGAPRSAGDVLHFQGYSNPSQLAATARMVTQYEMGALQGRRGESISTNELLTTIEKYPILAHSVDVAMRSKGYSSMTPIPGSVLATAHWMIAETNGVEEADSFITRVHTLQGEAPGSPVLALSRRANEIKRASVRVKRKDWLALVIKAYNYDATGNAVNKLAMYSKTGEYVNPVVAPRTSAPFLVHQDEEDETASPNGIDESESA